MKLVIALVSLVLVAFTALIVLINLIKGLIRGFKKTVGTLAAIIISAVIAAIVTAFVCNPDSAAMAGIIDGIRENIPVAEIQELFGIEELTESVSYYISMIIAPFVFVVLYSVISIIVAIIVGIIVKIVPPHEKPNAVLHRLGGLGLGLVSGLLVSVLLLMPVSGILSIVINSSDSISSDIAGDEVSDILDEVSEDKVIAVYAALGGRIFDSFASARYNGERVYLKDEVKVIISVLDNVSEISGEASEFDEKQVDALNNVIDSLDHSPLLKNTLAGVLSQMASNWVADKPFVGIERIDAGELLNPLLNSIFRVLASSTKDTITEDMTTLVDIIDVMVEYKILENLNDFEKILETLSDIPEGEGSESAIEALLNVANANPRMSGLADEITQLSIRALASTLGIPADHNERYNMLMDEIADILNQSHAVSSDRTEYVTAQVTEALDSYGIKVDGSAARYIALSLINDFGSSDNVSGDAIKEFFMIYAVASESYSEAKNNTSATATLSSGGSSSGSISVDPDSGAIMLGDYTFKYYYASSYTDSSAYRAGEAGLDFGTAGTLYSAESMESDVITLEDIFNAGGEGEKSKKFSELSKEEARAEAKRFSELLSLVGELFGGDFENINYREMIKDMGAVLDKMSEMQTLGSAATAELVKAIFRSDALIDSLGLPKEQLSERALDLINNAQREDSSYTSATVAIGRMLEMIDKVNDKNATKEEKIETTKELMSNMTQANAEMLSNMATPEMMKDYVKDENKAEQVADSVSTLFDNMSKLDTDDEEEYKKEAEAVNHVLSLAMQGSESENTSIFSEFDEDGNVINQGKMDTDAKGFVSLVADSQVVSQTLKDTVESGEDPYGINPSDEDEAVLTEALVNHYDENKEGLDDAGRDELKETLTNIAKISNIAVPEFN